MKFTPKEVKEKYLATKDTWDAASASWNVTDAAYAIEGLLSILRSEAYQSEQADTRTILGIIAELGDYLTGEVRELYDELAKPTPEMFAVKEAGSTLQVTKDKDSLRWVLFTSSAFEDKDGDIVSLAALEKDCDQMELTGDYGELLWWHCDGDVHEGEKEARPYLPLGKCDFSMVYNKINIESGTFYDQTVGDIIMEKAAKLGASKSFWYSEPDGNVYTNIRTKERSLMFRPKESNFLTRLFKGS